MEDEIVKVNLTAIKKYFEETSSLDSPTYKMIEWIIYLGNETAEGRTTWEEQVEKFFKCNPHAKRRSNS